MPQLSEPIPIGEVITRFGFDPTAVGLRYRGWFIVEVIQEEEKQAGAEIGDLAVRARDGGYNPPDPNAFRKPNYRGTACDGFDITYRYYYYKPLEALT